LRAEEGTKLDERIPDYPEPLRAFRVWRLDMKVPQDAVHLAAAGRLLDSELPLVLRSRNGLAMWQPGRNVAECRWYEYGPPPSWPEKGPPAETHEAPWRECGCGLYGGSEWPAPKFWSYWDDAGCHLLVHFYVSGLMQAWGRIIEHQTGIRAQYARVIALLDPSEALGLSTGDAKAVAALVRRTAEAYHAAYVAHPAHLRTIHAQGLEWFHERGTNLETATASDVVDLRDGDERMPLFPPSGSGPVSTNPDEEDV
jgi:hypothetical protein